MHQNTHTNLSYEGGEHQNGIGFHGLESEAEVRVSPELLGRQFHVAFTADETNLSQGLVVPCKESCFSISLTTSVQAHTLHSYKYTYKNTKSYVIVNKIYRKFRSEKRIRFDYEIFQAFLAFIFMTSIMNYRMMHSAISVNNSYLL